MRSVLLRRSRREDDFMACEESISLISEILLLTCAILAKPGEPSRATLVDAGILH